MICPGCNHANLKKHGRDRKGNQRYRCCDCGKTLTHHGPRPLGDMRIDPQRAEMVLRLLLEGNSIRSAERLTGVSKRSILRLVVLVGDRCKALMESIIYNVRVSDIQCDEIWGFVGCKKKTAERLGRGIGEGDAWCFTAIDRDTKLLVAWHLDKRTTDATEVFARKVAYATTGPIQLTTDGFYGYRDCVPAALGGRVHFAQYIKIFGPGAGASEGKYSPAQIKSSYYVVRIGRPKESRISTSHAERHNLTIRMQMRRMTRLTNGFSKKWANHEAALALFFAYYNFCRVHSTIKSTPAVAAKLADHTWGVAELLEKAAAY